MSGCKAPDQVGSILDDVRAAGDGAADEKAAKEARQTRASDPGVITRISAIHEGSPDGVRLRRELAALGISAGRLAASLKWLRDRSRAAPARARQRPEREPDGRPEIDVGTDLHVVAAAATDALRADQNLYQRDGALVHVLCAGEADERPGLLRGTPILRGMVAATLTLRMSAAAVWLREGKRGPSVTTPPGQIVAGVLAMGEWRGIRPMVGIVERPSLRPDGTIIDEPGYDAATGFLYCPNNQEFNAA